jgi:hypothetical protein
VARALEERRLRLKQAARRVVNRFGDRRPTVELIVLLAERLGDEGHALVARWVAADGPTIAAVGGDIFTPPLLRAVAGGRR